MVNNKNNSPTLVIGIGASAGGLDALKRFFKSVPQDSGLAFIVVQHLDPTHKSMMADILGRVTSLSVHEAKNEQKIEANCAYIIPPNAYIEVTDHTIKLSKPKQTRGSRMSIDYLFRSMAEVYRSQGIGVLFSGAGSDGTAGLRALKAAGGLSIVQDPKTAEHASMPRSAIDAGVVDRILKIDEIADTLIDYANHPYVEFDEDDTEDDTEDDLRAVGALLKTHENFDLDQYKESTVYRRICRRMSLTGKSERNAYIDLLRNDNDERQHLMRDLLINVTDFFRDPQAFDVLEEKVINNLIDEAEPGTDIRVWVAGCASGEEAYSLAMLILEKIIESGKDLDLKIFATDVDEEAIKTARRGVYPASITSELPDSYLEKYFTSIDKNYYKVLAHLRDKISFATQNVYADPPFSKMDLISCRNLLIYLRRAVQERVLKSFYFALNQDGYLFLGSSETIGEQKKLFKQLSQKWRVFKKQANADVQQTKFITPSFISKRPNKSQSLNKAKNSKTQSASDKAREALLKCVGPSVLINEDNQILYIHGNLNNFISIPEGEPQLDFIQMLDPSLRTRLRSGIFKARRDKDKIVIHSPKNFTEENPDKDIFQAVICPANHDSIHEGSLIITFEEIAIYENASISKENLIMSEDQDKMVETMERELLDTREELQNTVEELETSTEELKASHEEALSTNEELQSANEELEASTEELRSLNEELTTVNSQLKDKIDQLQNAHNDLSNFFASTNLATLFLSNDLKVMRYTPSAERLLRMGPQDLERPINEISRLLIDDNTLDDAQEVLDSLESNQKEIETDDGRWFIRKILPYRTEDKRIAGVVLTFNDITELKHATQNVETRERQHAVVAKLGMEALSGDDIQNLMDHAVREVAHTLDAHYCKVLEYHPEQKELFLKAGIGWQNNIVGKVSVPSDTGSQAGYTLKENGPVIVDDLEKEKRFSGPELLTNHKVISGISCIIENGDYPYGILGVHSRDKKNYTKDDANFLMSVANLLSITIHKKQTQQELRESEQRLRMAKDSNHFGAFEYNIVTGEMVWDDILKEIWGLHHDEEPAMDIFYKCLHPEDLKKTQDAIEASSEPEGDGHYHAIYRVINKINNNQSWVEASGQVIFENNQPLKMVGMIIDVTTQKNLEVELIKNQNLIKAVTDNIPNPLFAKDTERRLLFANKATYEACNKKSEDILGKKDEDWLADQDVAMHIKKHDEMVLEKGEPVKFEETMIAPDGTKRFYIGSKMPWRDDNGKIIGLVGGFTDIHDRKKLEDTLNDAVIKLDAANTKKNEFLATLGHELRNPLAAINGAVQIMQLDIKKSDWALDMMTKNVKLISSLLDDLLDLTRIERGKIKLQKEVLSLNNLLKDAVENFHPKITNKKQEIITKIPKEIIYVNADRTRLEQILNNLLINSHKFTPEKGKITIALQKNDKSAIITVKDTGIGIAKDQFDKIFNPFEQINTSKMNETGLGIGLSLVHKFVKLHDGKIEVDSKGVNKGSVFTITLPLSCKDARAATNKNDEHNPIKKKLRVMIIDDNKDAVRGLKSILVKEKCHVNIAHTGKSALKKIGEFKPEALIIDVGLPDISGYNLIKEIKRLNNDEGLYIAVTGYGHEKAKDESKKAGFDYHLNKPANVNNILKILSKIN